MQEAPDPMTKLTWGNAALISPATARAQKPQRRRHDHVSKGNYKLEAAVMVQPGQMDDAVTIALGYGRTVCGNVGKRRRFQRESDPHLGCFLVRRRVRDCSNRCNA